MSIIAMPVARRDKMCSKRFYVLVIITSLCIFSGTSQAAENILLPGTEVVLSLQDKQNPEIVAKNANKGSKLPIFLVRKLDKNHALYGVDQMVFLDRLKQSLMTCVADVEFVKPSGPVVMGKHPVPKLQVSLKANKKMRCQALQPDVYGKTYDWNKQAKIYKLLADRIQQITHLPVEVHGGKQRGTLFVVPAFVESAKMIKSKLISVSGNNAEIVKLATPFGAAQNKIVGGATAKRW